MEPQTSLQGRSWSKLAARASKSYISSFRKCWCLELFMLVEFFGGPVSFSSRLGDRPANVTETKSRESQHWEKTHFRRVLRSLGGARGASFRNVSGHLKSENTQMLLVGVVIPLTAIVFAVCCFRRFKVSSVLEPNIISELERCQRLTVTGLVCSGLECLYLSRTCANMSNVPTVTVFRAGRCCRFPTSWCFIFLT